MSTKITKVSKLSFTEICRRLEQVGKGSKHYQHLLRELKIRSTLQKPKAVDLVDWMERKHRCTTADAKEIALRCRETYEAFELS